jgi:hypothetical protein
MKVLILAHDFPPYVSVGGLRPYSWMKYLSVYDIHPVIVTRNWNDEQTDTNSFIRASTIQTVEQLYEEEYTLIKTPFRPNFAHRLLLKKGPSHYRILRQFYSLMMELLQFFLPIGTKRPIYCAAKDYLKTYKVDMIIATGEPFVLFHYAKKLSAEYGVPWIADYRDPWCQDVRIQHNLFLQTIYRTIEKRTVKTARAITTVSENFIMLIQQINPTITFQEISNGFDLENLVSQTNGEKETILKIGLNGTILNWHPYISFFKVLNQIWLENQINFELNLIGISNQEEIVKFIETELPDIIPFVNFYPKISNDAFFQVMTENNVLILFNYYAIMGTKIYDYLAMNRKILLLYTDDDDANKLKQTYYPTALTVEFSNSLQADLLKKTNSGIAVKDAEQLLNILIQLNEELLTTGKIAHTPTAIEEYSRKNQVKKLADFIKTNLA